MPESTCLHIQDRESGPIRVVELPWISVRIGRAAYCEVRLAEHDLAEEACRLTRRGRTWTLTPRGERGLVLLEGRAVEGPCPLPFDMPFRVGPYCLTLRRDVAAEPDWGMYPGPLPPQLPPPAPSSAGPIAGDRERPRPGSAPAADAAAADAPPARDLGRWQARWKAAEAHLRARTDRLRAGGEAPRAAFGPRLDPIPLKEPQAARPQGAETPWIDPAARSPRPSFAVGPTPKAPKIAAIQPDPAQMGRAVPLPGDMPTVPWACGPSPPSSPAHAHADVSRPPGDPVGLPPDSPREPPNSSSAQDEALPERRPLEGNEGDRLLPRGGDDLSSSGPSTDQPQPRRGGAGAAGREIPPSWGRPDDRPRAVGRDEKRRKAGRDREGAGRRDEAAPRARPGVESRGPGANRRAGTSARGEVEWPSVQDILANHRPDPGPQPAATSGPGGAGQALPTDPRAPDAWELPLWLAWPPLAVSVLVAGLAGSVLSWWWAVDSQSAAIPTRRLLVAEEPGHRRPLPESVVPPDGSWVRTTAQHLAHWAIFLGAVEGDETHSAREVASLLARALHISPLNPTARLALAQLERRQGGGAKPSRSLGLSRDAISLAWSARVLLGAGKKEAALRLYGRALAVAARGGWARAATPRFNDDPAVHRYLLPGEEAVRDIVGELAAQTEWPFGEWSRALPDHPTVLLATARLLRQQGRGEAESLLGRILDDGRLPASGEPADPRTLAARAEAFALRSRFPEAEREYRQAIERIDDETIRRSWWFNLADLVPDEGQRQAALRAALAVAHSDDITRRATQIQRAAAPRPRLRLGNAQAP